MGAPGNKIIFLDVDGVLNSHLFLYSAARKDKKRKYPVPAGSMEWWLEMIDPDAVEVLNQIIRPTDPKIVISSTWRINKSVHYLQMLMAAAGVEGDVIDVTPVHGIRRGMEIDAWLNDHQVESFVILDDDDDMEPWNHRLVQTSFKLGLTMGEVDRAIDMLHVPLSGYTAK